ncbi:MAG: hypothetical protein L0Y72_27630 [Gemmataceae bacterium]|nr:hypothetical protein [Gemmataceae bacterium]MCI0742818.1 hypothetical protein [Gemmataceae bacterium]
MNLRISISAMVGAALCFSLASLDAQDEKAGVKRLEVKGQKSFPKGDVKKPAVVENDKELAKSFPDKEVQGQIAKDVDFEKHRVLYFGWSGSGQDRLLFEVDLEAKTVVFHYKPGLTRDLRPHHYVFRLNKDLKWKVK